MAHEPHALGGQLVEMRRFDLVLAIAAEFTIAEVIGEDEDDVRRCRSRGGDRGQKGDEYAARFLQTAELPANSIRVASLEIASINVPVHLPLHPTAIQILKTRWTSTKLRAIT